VSSDSTYWYRVQALGPSSTVSAYSNVASAVTESIPYWDKQADYTNTYGYYETQLMDLSEGSLYAATGDGFLVRFDETSPSFTKLFHATDTFNNEVPAAALCQYRNKLYMGDQWGGLYRYDTTAMPRIATGLGVSRPVGCLAVMNDILYMAIGANPTLSIDLASYLYKYDGTTTTQLVSSPPSFAYAKYIFPHDSTLYATYEEEV
jgi:hypothetical protein